MWRVPCEDSVYFQSMQSWCSVMKLCMALYPDILSSLVGKHCFVSSDVSFPAWLLIVCLQFSSRSFNPLSDLSISIEIYMYKGDSKHLMDEMLSNSVVYP